MFKGDYIRILAKASKTENHELIEECLKVNNKLGTCELTIDELHNFCIVKGLLHGNI